MRQQQQGFFLIEAMVAALIFALGILGMVSLSASAINAQSDARYRTDAAKLASDMASEIDLNVDRTSALTVQNSLAAYQHLPTGTGCAFTGTASSNVAVLAWVDKVRADGTGAERLPGATTQTEQILIDATSTGFNRVQITVCWKTPADLAMRKHTLVTYVN